MADIGVYPGTFDPFTAGHLDVIRRASRLFDKIFIAVLNNTAKKPFFSADERVAQITAAIEAAGITNASADAYSGITVDYAASKGAAFLIRGVRGVMDFDYERQLESLNRRLRPEIETVFLFARPENAGITSTAVREIASLGGCIEGLVPDINKIIIAERLYGDE